jgi:universal stress protein E
MTVPRRILVVVDPTVDAEPAVQRAALVARKTRAQLVLFVCAYDAGLLENRALERKDLAKARAALLENHLRRLRSLAQPLAADGLEVEVDARWDSPLYEGIVRKALQCEADLVVKDTHYHSALKRSIFSNTDWNLIRACPTPLWLVKPRAMGSRPCFVAAVDPLHEHDKPAELDGAILTTADELCSALGGEVHVFHAFDTAPLFVAAGDAMTMPLLLPVREAIDVMQAHHTKALHELTDARRVPRDRVHMQQGGARQRLEALVEDLRADVVVMGAVSRRGTARFFIGNTAEDVLDKLACDLLIVKPAAVAAALRHAAVTG